MRLPPSVLARRGPGARSCWEWGRAKRPVEELLETRQVITRVPTDYRPELLLVIEARQHGYHGAHQAAVDLLQIEAQGVGDLEPRIEGTKVSDGQTDKVLHGAFGKSLVARALAAAEQDHHAETVGDAKPQEIFGREGEE